MGGHLRAAKERIWIPGLGTTTSLYKSLARARVSHFVWFSVWNFTRNISVLKIGTIITPKGHVNITGHFSCIMDNVVYCLTSVKCPSTVYIGETGHRLAEQFREHRGDVINGRNDLPVPAHSNQANHTVEDMKVAVLKAGLANQDYRKKQEMRFIFRYGSVAPSGLNQAPVVQRVDSVIHWISYHPVDEICRENLL